jgi:hypothetical protein
MKVYLGKTETKETEYGKLHKVSFGPKDFEKLNQYKNDSGWVNCLIKESKEGSLYLEIDTFKPKPKTAEAEESYDSPF